MNTDTIKKIIAEDVAKVQHNSDVLSQWPISSVEAMYYSGPFLLKNIAPLFFHNQTQIGLDSKQKFFSGKLSNLIFYFLNEKTKGLMGEENYKNLMDAILKRIFDLRDNVDHRRATVLPEWTFDSIAQEINSQKIVFLLDNLIEMVNPIFRSFGFQLFFKDDKVFRYYFRSELKDNVVVISPIGNMEIDYFEHIISPEELEHSKLYTEKDGVLYPANTEILQEKIIDRMGQLKKERKFDRQYVMEQIFSAFEIPIDKNMSNFFETPFPVNILEFYKKTCELPIKKLESGIFNLIK